MTDKKDLFVELPECLLHIIISFLPFKEAAKTSILSKRWVKLWHGTRNIEFDESFFVRPHQASDASTKAMNRRVFIDFVNKWVGNYREPGIDKFALRFSKPEQFVHDIENFISFAIGRNVKGLSLDFSDPDQIHESNSLFDLSSCVYEQGRVVESLKLFSCKIDMSGFKIFSLLKDLSLGWIELKEENYSIKTILQNCPLLESLSVTKCWNIKPFFLSNQPIASIVLKHLVIDTCSFRDPNWIGVGNNAPKLHFFKYSGRDKYLSLDCNLSCLEEFDLNFGLKSSLRDLGDFLYSLLGLLDLSSVAVLTVCSYMLQVVPNNSKQPLHMEIPLMNVRHLILKTALHPNEFYGISFFLSSCPLLETLTIQLCPARLFPDYMPVCEIKRPYRFWKNNLMVYKCIHFSLKVVEVKRFKGSVNEFLVLEHLICFGRVLERLNLYMSREFDDQENGSGNVELDRERGQMLLQLKMASKKLQISIIE